MWRVCCYVALSAAEVCTCFDGQTQRPIEAARKVPFECLFRSDNESTVTCVSTKDEAPVVIRGFGEVN